MWDGDVGLAGADTNGLSKRATPTWEPRRAHQYLPSQFHENALISVSLKDCTRLMRIESMSTVVLHSKAPDTFAGDVPIGDK